MSDPFWTDEQIDNIAAAGGEAFLAAVQLRMMKRRIEALEQEKAENWPGGCGHHCEACARRDDRIEALEQKQMPPELMERLNTWSLQSSVDVPLMQILLYDIWEATLPEASLGEKDGE